MRTQSTAHPPRVLVTGASGFIGKHLQRALTERGFDYRGAVRGAIPGDNPYTCVVGDLGPSTDWSAALNGIDSVVHLAGRAHVLRETSANPEDEFNRVNAEATAALMAAAVSAGVRRLVYVSSIGVLGSESGDGPFTAGSVPRPHNGYTRSKLAGEIAARAVADAQTEVVILRLPLVYGSGVKANFLRLLRWVDKEWPLPLGAVHNRRSLLSVWNLVDLLVNVLLHPKSPGRTWMVSDGEDVSTPGLNSTSRRRHGTTCEAGSGARATAADGRVCVRAAVLNHTAMWIADARYRADSRRAGMVATAFGG